MKKPKSQVATLGQFVRSWDESTHRESKQKVIVFAWGPVLLVFPRHLKDWR